MSDNSKAESEAKLQATPQETDVKEENNSNNNSDEEMVGEGRRIFSERNLNLN
jgi:hypothetical protein